jgi:N-acetylglucosaminyldiphosphoundecaprenol N-acetyl-beta-D-mannosaminyltransferase
MITRNVWSILGLPFDKVTLADAKSEIESAVLERNDLFLTTPNLNFVINAQSDTIFFQSVVDSDLSVADGMPIIWIAKLLGIPITERVAGSTLFDKLANAREKNKKIQVYFFGGQEGIAEQAYHKLNERSISMACCGFHDPGFVSVEEMSSPEIINKINASAPDFIVVALGAQKGQAWIQKNRKHLSAPVISHLGAVINFVAGNIKRAPNVWQRYGCEWLWRIKQEPTLWRRYFFDGLKFLKLLFLYVLPLAIYDRILKRRSCFRRACEFQLDSRSHTLIRLIGSAHTNNFNLLKDCFASLLESDDNDVVIDCEKLEYIDAAFIATLMLFQRYLNEQNRQLSLQTVPKRIIRIFSLNNVRQRFTIETLKNLKVN